MFDENFDNSNEMTSNNEVDFNVLETSTHGKVITTEFLPPDSSDTEDEIITDEEYDPERYGTSKSKKVNKVVRGRHACGLRRRGANRRGGVCGRGVQRKASSEDVWDAEIPNQENTNSAIPFLERTGLSRQAGNTDTIRGHFLLFFTEEILNKIISESNRYSEDELELTYDELLAFIGVVIAMGIIQLPEMSDYWSTSPITQVPWFSTIFTGKRFFTILANLHLVDNIVEGADQANKLYILGNIMETCNQSFQQHYLPSQNLAIDEQMIGTRCRIGFIQYMPKNLKRFGIKLWVLCESLTGYVLKFIVYTGKTDEVVLNCLAYTGLKLVEDLEKRNTFTCGTVRKNHTKRC